jgi:hypothetical protein
MRESTAQAIIDTGFGMLLGDLPANGICKRCGHLFGPHRFVASFGSPLDGGLYYCQDYPGCPCTGTWGPNIPEDLKAQARDL